MSSLISTPTNKPSPDLLLTSHSPNLLLQHELLTERDSFDNTSLQVYKMFNKSHNLIPKNERILNLSWRINSASRIRKDSNSSQKRRCSKSLSASSVSSVDSLFSNKNILLLNASSTDHLLDTYNTNTNTTTKLKSKSDSFPNNKRKSIYSKNLSNDDSASDFNYIEHIRRISKEEYNISNDLPQSVPASDFNMDIFESINNPSISDISLSPSSLHTNTKNNTLIDNNNSTATITNTNNNTLDLINNDNITFQNFLTSEDFNIDCFLNLNDSSEQEADYNLNNYINTLQSSLKSIPASIKTTSQQQSQLQSLSTPSTLSNKTRTISSSNDITSTTNHPVCENCFTTTTPLWRKTSDNRLLCNACGLFFKLHGVIRPPAVGMDSQNSKPVNNQQLTHTNNQIPVTTPTTTTASATPSSIHLSSSAGKKRNFSTAIRNHDNLNTPLKTAPISMSLPDTHMGETLSTEWDWLKFEL